MKKISFLHYYSNNDNIIMGCLGEMSYVFLFLFVVVYVVV